MTENGKSNETMLPVAGEESVPVAQLLPLPTAVEVLDEAAISEWPELGRLTSTEKKALELVYPMKPVRGLTLVHAVWQCWPGLSKRDRRDKVEELEPLAIAYECARDAARIREDRNRESSDLDASDVAAHVAKTVMVTATDPSVALRAATEVMDRMPGGRYRKVSRTEGTVAHTVQMTYPQEMERRAMEMNLALQGGGA